MSVVLIPIISEKANIAMEDLNQYSFYVQPKANKIQIKKEIEEMYNVTVEDISTSIMRPKLKTKYTKTGVQTAQTNKMKKAVVKLKEGDSIDIYAV